MKKQQLAVKLAAVVMGLSVAGAFAAGKVNIYNWQDYIADNTTKDFQKETSITPKYDVYDSNETLQAKLLTGKSGYDVVHPSMDFAAKQIKSGIYMKLDKTKLPNLANLNPTMLEKLKAADPTGEYLLPYMWGTAAFGINVDKVKKALGSEPMPADMWELVFNPKYTSKLKSCGISFMESASDVYAMYNIYKGRDMMDFSKETLEANNKELAAVRKDIKVFIQAPIDLLANGDVCVAMGFNGDVYIARDRAKEAKKPQNIEYVVPNKGTQLWIDVMAIPKDSKNVAEAHQWINYIMKPEVVAAISNKVNYANPNTKATPMVDKKLRDDPKIYLSDEALGKLQPKKPMEADTQKRVTAAFNKFKTSK
ncbi:extracellular solute-binding protein [Chitinivorax sp. B]|uniref:extracellular solute-binding protein n=1 Tax=Chitinivorax sp. B TaxID=2502235 RepID=UPI0010F99CFD|nr:extracellular solute-binding protein [Chitinivorax sp. B]